MKLSLQINSERQAIRDAGHLQDACGNEIQIGDSVFLPDGLGAEVVDVTLDLRGVVEIICKRGRQRWLANDLMKIDN